MFIFSFCNKLQQQQATTVTSILPLLLAIVTIAITLSTPECSAQPVFNDPRFGCAEKNCTSDWNTAQRTIQVPEVPPPCQVVVTYKWRRCEGETEVVIERTTVRANSSLPWGQVSCLLHFLFAVNDLIGATDSVQGYLQPNELKMRIFYENVFFALTEQLANDFYFGVPPSERHRQECGSGQEQKSYLGLFASCYNTCTSIISGNPDTGDSTMVFLDHIPCGPGCCKIRIETCWENDNLVTTKSYENTAENCSLVPIPAPTCPEGEMNIMQNECFQFCGEE